jgi:hypothetical protein
MTAAAIVKEQGNMKSASVCLLPQQYFEVGSLHG